MIDRKSHWENVYQDKSPLAVSWYQKEPALSLQLIRATGVGKDEAIIDVGGGASVLVDFLHNEGFSSLAVLDISGKALDFAKRRLADNAECIEWYESDITQFRSPHLFSLWHDRAVFHFLTEKNDRIRYVETLKQTLKVSGHLIIAAFAIGGPEKCSGLDIVQYDAEKLSRELGSAFRLVEQSGETHLTPANRSQAFNYFLFRYQPDIE